MSKVHNLVSASALSAVDERLETDSRIVPPGTSGESLLPPAETLKRATVHSHNDLSEANRRSSRKRAVISLLLVGALTGCFMVRQPPPELRPPQEVAAHYLKSLFNPDMRRDVYELLTTRARAAVPYQGFVSLRNGEVSHILGSPSSTDTRVSVSPLDQYDFSDDYSVVYALLSIRYPYSIGERETYRLVRLHCYKEGGQWAIEPFMHAQTGTIILVPTRMRGPLWKISRDMELIASTVRDEISTYGERIAPPPEKTVPAESAEETPLVVLDVPQAQTPKPSPEPLETRKKLDALLSIGKLCYEAGKIDAADDTFRRVLALDPNNAVAKDYLSRCESYRVLQKEKEDAVRLMEELLRLDSEGGSAK